MSLFFLGLSGVAALCSLVLVVHGVDKILSGSRNDAAAGLLLVVRWGGGAGLVSIASLLVSAILWLL